MTQGSAGSFLGESVARRLRMESKSLRLSKQRELFPLTALLEVPDDTGTADAWGKVVASDTHPYIVKGCKGGERVRAAEWLGTHIADALNLPVPDCKIVRMKNGDLNFGSREIAGIASKIDTANILTTNTIAAAGLQIPALRSLISAVYAYDMAVFNRDRHQENFISIENFGIAHFI